MFYYFKAVRASKGQGGHQVAGTPGTIVFEVLLQLRADEVRDEGRLGAALVRSQNSTCKPSPRAGQSEFVEPNKLWGLKLSCVRQARPHTGKRSWWGHRLVVPQGKGGLR